MVNNVDRLSFSSRVHEQVSQLAKFDSYGSVLSLL